MYFNFYHFFLLLKKYIKQKNMRLLLTFIIFILGVFYTFGKENCCEQCCEYLEKCCKKGEEEKEKKEENKEEKEKEGEEDNGKGKKEENKKEEEKELEEFCLKKNEEANLEEIKKLISTDWYDNKGEEASFILYEKIDDAENQNINKKDVIKIKKDKNGFSVEGNFIPEKDNNEQKWALFEIIYKEEKGEEEGEKNDEENEKENKENETKYLYCSNIESDKINGIFESCKQHISISVIACNTSNVTDMRYMFSECNSLTKLNLSNFNTDNVTNMGCMFHSCSSLENLNLNNFNTKKVTDMGGMFSNCTFLQTLDLKNFDTNKVTDMSCMFYECTSLQTLDLPNSKIGAATKIENMFDSCNELHTVIFNEEQQVDKKNLPDNNVPQDKVNLQEIIENQLKKLGQWDKQEEENKITLGKKPQT